MKDFLKCIVGLFLLLATIWGIGLILIVVAYPVPCEYREDILPCKIWKA